MGDRSATAPIPIYITENGAAFPDPDTAPPGGVRGSAARGLLAASSRGDPARRCAAASTCAVTSCGRCIDNFEWAQRLCSHRFGLVHVDYATQQRTVKASGEFYRDVIRTNGAALTSEAAARTA